MCGLIWCIILSLQTAVLGMFYIIAMGYALHLTGTQMNIINDFHWTFSNGGLSSYRLLFAGSFLACLFWVNTIHHLSSPTLYMCVYSQAVVQAMWPWYATGMETEEELAEDKQVNPIILCYCKASFYIPWILSPYWYVGIGFFLSFFKYFIITRTPNTLLTITSMHSQMDSNFSLFICTYIKETICPCSLAVSSSQLLSKCTCW